jgi:competence protein ComEC
VGRSALSFVTFATSNLIMDKIRECSVTIYDLRSKINMHMGKVGEGVSCDEAGCVAQMGDGALVALALKPDALSDDCGRAALVVTARQAPPSCPSSVIDLERLRRQGAMALSRTGSGFALGANRPKGINRPWSPAVGGDGETEATLAPRLTAPRAVDATPAEADLQAED